MPAIPYPPEDERQRFRDLLFPTLAEVCPRWGVDPEKAFQAAADHSCYGRYVLAHNYWGVAGAGSRGFVGAITMVRKPSRVGDGGVVGRRTPLAKFATPREAAIAYCRAYTTRRYQ